MNLYTLDSLYRYAEIVDDYSSLIWTERHRAWGDFELHLPSSRGRRTLFQVGTRLSVDGSYRVMVVETVEDSVDADGVATLKITGKSLEAILDDRLARGTLGDTTATPKWTLTGAPADIARQIFHDICVTGILDVGDILTVTEASIFPEDTIVEPPDSVTVELDPTTVYQAIKSICDAYELGFRLVRNPTNTQLYFDVYTGSDRTARQTTLPAVVFSPELDNLQNINEFRTIAGAKNVAYVISPVGHAVVYPLNVDPTIFGFDRHVLIVKADDITDPDATIATALMVKRGNDELSKYRTFSGFDGEISQSTSYVYGVDYNLGDFIEMRNSDGVINQMQVTEHIRVSDQQGVRSYPTLSLHKFINAGSWSGWPTAQVWHDLDVDPQTWADQA